MDLENIMFSTYMKVLVWGTRTGRLIDTESRIEIARGWREGSYGLMATEFWLRIMKKDLGLDSGENLENVFNATLSHTHQMIKSANISSWYALPPKKFTALFSLWIFFHVTHTPSASLAL